MRVPMTMSIYIGRQFLIGILLAFLAMTVIVGLLEIAEMGRRASSRPEVGFGLVLEMAFLDLPKQTERLFPFAVMVGSMFALMRLTRTQELVAARAAGVSVWQFMLPAILIALGLGLFSVMIYNPVASAMVLKYEKLESKYFKNRPSLLTLSSSGLWLRQVEDSDPAIGEYIIHAQRMTQKDMRLYDVILFSFDAQHHFIQRVDAQNATLEDGYWHFQQVSMSTPGLPPERSEEMRLKTDLTLAQIQDSFAPAKTMSFWELPGFITTLEKAGFSALKHRLYLHTLLATPLLLIGILFIAATFSLRLPRRGGIGLMVVAGVLTGFMLRFLTTLVNALGLTGELPVELAAWTPAAISVMIGMAMLLHLEDG